LRLFFDNREGSTGSGSYYIYEPATLAGDYEESISRKFTWSDEFKTELQRIRRFEAHEIACYTRKNPEIFEGAVQYPSNLVEYVPEHLCPRSSDSTRTSTRWSSEILFLALLTLSMFQY